MKKSLSSLAVLMILSCSQYKDSSLLNDILNSMDQKHLPIVNDPDEHFLQIIYTQIDRDTSQAPKFTTHTYNIDPKKYFYPASTVKFPAAVLALDKLRRYESLGITRDTKLTIDSSRDWMLP